MPASQKKKQIQAHVKKLLACDRCPKMGKPVVSGGPVASRVMLVGQAPGPREPLMGKPFAWTAGKTMFRWFHEASGIGEEEFRSRVYMAAVCRCFPGKSAHGGDRVPEPQEIAKCSEWLEAEISILKPALILLVGKLAIEQFLDFRKLNEVVGETFQAERAGVSFEVLPLPHPSGASVWHRVEPGKTLLKKSLKRMACHPVYRSEVLRVSKS